MSMTEREYTNEELIDFMYAVMDDSDIEATPLINEVISALEEIQHYRAIGTVEDIQMVFQLCKELQVMCGQYNDIGTVEELRELKEKATPKKPIDVRYFAEAGYSIGLCPTCNSGINSEFKYCGDCCQCLDWSEGKE